MGIDPGEDITWVRDKDWKRSFTKLSQVDVVTAQRSTMADAIRWICVIESTYYRCRIEFGGLQTNQARRIKDLEQEKARLRRAVSDLTIDKMILDGGIQGTLRSPSCRWAYIDPVRQMSEVFKRPVCQVLG